MNFLYCYRAVILVLSFILTIPVLGLIAHWMQGSLLNNVTYPFEPMGLYTASLTIVVIPIMLVLPIIRKNAFALYTMTELSIVFLLWIFWIVVAALAIQQKGDFYPLDNCTHLTVKTVHWCSEMFAVVGLSVVIFVILMKYMLILLIYAIVMTFRVGARVWFQSIIDMQIRMPAITHNTGDLESKARRDKSSVSIPMTSYSAPVPMNSTYNAPQQAPQQQPYGQYNQQKLQPTFASPQSNPVGLGSPPQVKMQVTSSTAGRPTQQSLYHSSVAEV